ncbi:unnamed protein product [Vicia faba]|uniref:Uncharacterized protein n=1 Tax=Vicia faba TaxID=3906 RepID=A0AAV0YNH1_VICFA|nr:unnamed protein product [Vicia faba]
MNENTISFMEESVMEKVLHKRSLRMRNMQRSWQESPEGKKMLEFQKSLPSFKEKEGLLQAIASSIPAVANGASLAFTESTYCHNIRDSETKRYKKAQNYDFEELQKSKSQKDERDTKLIKN